MTDLPPALVHMLAAWNEGDRQEIRRHLEQALRPDVRFVDPSIDLTGIDDFERNVIAVHERLPGATYSRTSEVDLHHDVCRYSWAIHRDGAVLLPGFDVTQLDAEGKVAMVLGFFGPLPDLEST